MLLRVEGRSLCRGCRARPAGRCTAGAGPQPAVEPRRAGPARQADKWNSGGRGTGYGDLPGWRSRPLHRPRGTGGSGCARPADLCCPAVICRVAVSWVADPVGARRRRSRSAGPRPAAGSAGRRGSQSAGGNRRWPSRSRGAGPPISTCTSSSPMGRWCGRGARAGRRRAKATACSTGTATLAACLTAGIARRCPTRCRRPRGVSRPRRYAVAVRPEHGLLFRPRDGPRRGGSACRSPRPEPAQRHPRRARRRGGHPRSGASPAMRRAPSRRLGRSRYMGLATDGGSRRGRAAAGLHNGGPQPGIGARARPAESVLSVEDARQPAGGLGDPLRAIESLPGVGRPALGSGSLLLWGRRPVTPRDLSGDGAAVAVSRLGPARRAAGGAAVKACASSRRALGPSMAGRWAAWCCSRRALPDGWHGELAADLLDVSAMVSGAAGPRLRLLAAGRYSYLDRLLSALSRPDLGDYFPLPQYWDAGAGAACASGRGPAARDDPGQRRHHRPCPRSFRAGPRPARDARRRRAIAWACTTSVPRTATALAPATGQGAAACALAGPGSAPLRRPLFGQDTARLSDDWLYGLRASHRQTLYSGRPGFDRAHPRAAICWGAMPRSAAPAPSADRPRRDGRRLWPTSGIPRKQRRLVRTSA